MQRGPDVLTSCGNDRVLLRFNQQYVAGVGGGCQEIDDWSTLDSYSDGELQQLRDFARIFERGNLRCGAVVGCFPSISLLLVVAAITLLGY